MRIILITTLAVFAFGVAAQETTAYDALIQKAAECEALTAPDEIKKCGDEVRELMPAAREEIARNQAAAYAWNILDDGAESGEVLLAKRAQDDNSCRPSGGNVMMLSCTAGQTRVSFQFNNCGLPDGTTQGAIWTYGADEAYFDFVTNDQFFGVDGGEDAVALIKNMLAGPSILVTLAPTNAAQQTIKFRMAGLEEAITPLREACDW